MANYISPIFATGQAVDDALSKALTALQPNTTFAFNGTVGATTPNTGAFTTISAKATQDTATLGTELVTNGTFTTDLSGWTAGAGWTHNAGVAEHAAGSAEPLVQTIGGLTAGSYYQLSYTITRTAGTISSSLGTSVGGTGGHSTSGAKATAFKAAGTSQDLVFTPSSDFVGSVDGVSLKPITTNPSTVVSVTNTTGQPVFALRSCPTSTYNTFLGYLSGILCTSGAYNTSVGVNAMAYTIAGFANTAVGYGAQLALISGEYNCAFGLNAQMNITSGLKNVGVGATVQASLTSGSYNSAVGLACQSALTTGSSNEAFGNGAQGSLTTGSYNASFGSGSLGGISASTYNTALGGDAGRYIANGTTLNTASTTSVFVGDRTKALADSQSNQIVIGSQAVGLGSNSTVIGNSSTTQAKIFGSLEVTGPLKMSGYTVATLPSAVVGMRTYVTDATAPTYNATVTGGGAVKVPVFYNGTNWVTA